MTPAKVMAFGAILLFLGAAGEGQRIWYFKQAAGRWTNKALLLFNRTLGLAGIVVIVIGLLALVV